MDQRTLQPWTYAVRVLQGGRPSQDDAWAVAPAGHRLVAAVFDGVGGEPNGGAAARAAAAALPRLLADTPDSTALLAGLDRAARATGGATTCAGVRIADGAIEAFGAVDSLVFVLAGTTARPILPEHASARGLIDCLGHPRFHGSTARIEGKPEAVLLCTDGVHRVATNHALATALRESRHGVSAALDQLMLGINETTDNATALLIATR